ncbi:Monomethylamine methyltransferase MtmB [Moorella glycerini]|uniref:Monomethylamine methyltransferase MtmB n=1 Tax=Neomoorella stamsii TaxID=1266720 RepID=A0A9X7J529_9FIRM|nr:MULTISPECIES: monomethylamine:corrinoid methyltransferase [Moorella]PRR77183.1 Monomethylamine methyltransferase MtmB [Moorella stamsii]CEP67241.1 Monomethylamine methyltransferase MtmB [Moorella glycerini]
MLSLLEIAERTQTGPKMVEKEWDMKFFQTISHLVKEYQIKYPGDEYWFNMDDELVDRAFEAAIDFLVEMGVYCISTNRVVKFTKEEILEAIHDAPTEVIMGEGRDARVFKQRKIEGKEPLNFCPGHHTPFTEDLASLVVKNFAQIPRTDFIEGFNFPAIDGREIIGSPMEAYAARRQLAWMREGIRKAGRPGLAIVYYPINTRVASLVAGMDPDYGLRRTDGILLSLLPDLKMEHDMLAAAITYEDYGCFKLSGSFALAGGFCGGVEGAIIEGIAKPIAATMVYHDYIHYTGVEHVQSLSAQKILLQPYNWARSVVNQVLNTKTHVICMAWVIPTSGPGTENNLLESAIRCIEAPLNGANLYAPRHSRSRLNGGQTPLEAEWMLEVSDATIRAGLDRVRAGEILKKIAAKLEGRQPEQGYLIQECYDLVHHRPSEQYKAIYEGVKEELSKLGLAFI